MLPVTKILCKPYLVPCSASSASMENALHLSHLYESACRFRKIFSKVHAVELRKEKNLPLRTYHRVTIHINLGNYQLW